MLANKKILILAPHTDDGELGCGGTIARAVSEGAQVFYVAFSTAEASVPEGFARNQLEKEVRVATEILGIPEKQVFVYKYQVRKLNYMRQEILEELIRLRLIIRPEMVFLPSSKDIHQDHSTIYHEGVRAFKNSCLFGYELIWNNLAFSTDCFVELEETHLDTKVRALKAYKTQQERLYMNPEFIRSLATVRGTQINVKYAEAFEVIRIIL
ncbi:PIG-L deacetylase family protein [Flavilitoribacter nigricans]|uniref:LmbE family protein n=1 Tax=Flavilitoribacter nigricans (strain ATCC 23147 / DSM 23189 / NBRC 102662 / NCIMB 1420 / SS-2) TaxID=1122177 RepID=A0A2D0N177_FLAN2|nr:PIG-L deacetylase family protein [Flavilitoribacter nigricans]PHN01473.1 LmbE family protein [Flavilitoribacter nigricans DSM 23189 = NBRC 102662]